MYMGVSTDLCRLFPARDINFVGTDVKGRRYEQSDALLDCGVITARANDQEVLLEKIRKVNANEDAYMMVAEDAETGKLCGTVLALTFGDFCETCRPIMIIENVVTHADYRNQGYASALLQKASEIAKERCCYKLFLETGSNKESTLNFYRNNGFEIDQKHSCLKRL